MIWPSNHGERSDAAPGTDLPAGTRRPWWSTPLGAAAAWQITALIAMIAITGLAVRFYSRSFTGQMSRSEALGLLILYAASASLAGAFVGFLLGVPRTVPVTVVTNSRSKTGRSPLAATRGAVGSVDPSRQVIQPNANLQQVSDWLTKILVGATLVQADHIPAAASQLFRAMADGSVSASSGPAFVGALVIYSCLAGFIFGWLTARVWIGLVLAMADREEALLSGPVEEQSPLLLPVSRPDQDRHAQVSTGLDVARRAVATVPARASD